MDPWTLNAYHEKGVVGANCVVTEPVPDNGVVVGVPGRVMSYKGSINYLVNTVAKSGNCL
jgi:serine acetyltransferase